MLDIVRALSSRNVEDSIESFGLHVYASCGTGHGFPSTIYPSQNSDEESDDEESNEESNKEESDKEESDDQESEGDYSPDGEEVRLI